MKKNYNLFSVIMILVLRSNLLFSQTIAYQPFPLTGGTWEVESIVNQGSPPSVSSTTYYTRSVVDGDTVIGNYSYKKVYSSHTNGSVPVYVGTPSNGHWDWSFGPKNFDFAYRNDSTNKKVYIYTKIGGQYKDTLWYDFNLNLGDTLRPTYSFDTTTLMQKIIVESIDTVLICGEYRKVYGMGCNDSLIEGIGFSTNFVHTWSGDICFFEPSVIYSTSFQCYSVSIEEVANNIGHFELYPNPAEDIIQIKQGDQNKHIEDYVIIDCLGRVVLSGSVLVYNIIDVSNLEKGTYFLRIQDKENNIFQNKFIKQ
jgi:Secretion system C-terminal sorting domain